MARRQREEGENADTQRWMVTFSDLIILLLTFFVLLLSMSSLDAKKLRQTFSFLTGAPGVLEFSSNGEIADLNELINKITNENIRVMLDITVLKRILPQNVQDKPEYKEILNNIERYIDIYDDPRGFVISIQDKILFESGKTELKPESFPILDLIAKTILGCSYPILIMGHTDNIPLKRSIYRSNYELSVYRALNVFNYFTIKKSIPKSRFYVGGYGPSMPRFNNNSSEGRRKNRRVEIIFKI